MITNYLTILYLDEGLTWRDQMLKRRSLIYLTTALELIRPKMTEFIPNTIQMLQSPVATHSSVLSPIRQQLSSTTAQTGYNPSYPHPMRSGLIAYNLEAHF